MMRSLDDLVATAERAAQGMLKVATGKDPEEGTTSNARTFNAVGGIITEMVATTKQQQATNKELLAAMERIASLRVRGATELMEKGDWKRIAAELQAIAQECLANRA